MQRTKKKWRGKKPKAEWIEEKKDEVKSLLEKIEEGVKNFQYTPEHFQAILEMKAMTPQYSFKNLVLAKSQLPGASYLNSYEGWKKLGRYPRKGQLSIKILKPVFKKVKEKKEVDGKSVEVEKEEINYFLTVPVFDISQTDGKELPIEKFKLKLGGDDPEAERIIKSIHDICDCPITYGDTGAANGVYYPSLHRIKVADSLSTNHRAKTLVHEYVHSRVHRTGRHTKEEQECVAEGAAFVICSRFGLDTSDYSFQYVYGWSETPDSLMKYGNTIMNVSKSIIKAIEDSQEKEGEVIKTA